MSPIGTPVPDPEIDALVARAAQAHKALMVGDVGAYRELIRVADDFTLMAPLCPSGERA